MLASSMILAALAFRGIGFFDVGVAVFTGETHLNISNDYDYSSCTMDGVMGTFRSLLALQLLSSGESSRSSSLIILIPVLMFRPPPLARRPYCSLREAAGGTHSGTVGAGTEGAVEACRESQRQMMDVKPSL